jgi:predicted MFS family arabinose efflux permease
VAANSDQRALHEGALGPSALRESAAPISSYVAAGTPGRGPIVRYVTAIALSLYGDWLTTVALVVVLFELTGNPAGPAAYVLVRVTPRLFGPWWGGRLADRVSPRRIMVLAAIVQAAATASLIVSVTQRSLGVVYAAVAVSQFAGALGRPSQGAMVPSLVADPQLPRANATYGLFLNTSIFVGPALGAALLLRVGPNPLFAIDAATFVASALLSATLPSGQRPARLSEPMDRVSPVVHRPLLLALRRPEMRIVAAANFASGLTVTVTQALLVVAARERFGGDASVGFLYSSVGIGGALGGLVALRWVPARAWTRLAVFIATTGEVIALAGFSASTITVIAVLSLALGAAAASSFDTWGLTEVQRVALPGLMGRFNSIIFISLYAGMLVGAVWALATANVLHWDLAIQYACGAALVIVGVVWLVGGKKRTDDTMQEKKNPEETESSQGLVSER